MTSPAQLEFAPVTHPTTLLSTPAAKPLARPPVRARQRPEGEGLLTYSEAAEVLGISLRQFRRLVDGGKIGFVRVSERTPRILPAELVRFLEASKAKYSEVPS